MRYGGFAVVVLVLCGVYVAHADFRFRPFTAVCEEGETHRYDGDNSLDMMGQKAKGGSSGWVTESWGGLNLSWHGGDTLFLHVDGRTIPYMVIGENNSAIMAVVASSAWALNVYSLVIDPVLGEAVYSQVSAVNIGKSRSIKGRVQNLKCKVSWVK